MTVSPIKPCITVAFSGAGHLLAYHLGVASTLLRLKVPIQAVSGSSSGAIVAALLSFLPHQLENYADRFLQDRGHAFRNFREMILEGEKEQKETQTFSHATREEAVRYQSKTETIATTRPDLYVCVTKSDDGTAHLLKFPSQSLKNNSSDRLFRAIEASCYIPVSFHPLDLFQTSSNNYQGDGIDFDGTYYVDGGISGIFPPPLPDVQEPHHRILVCPVELGPLPTSLSFSSLQTNHVICPGYNSSSEGVIHWPFLKARDGISIRRPLKNLQSLVAAAGFCSGKVLASWYQRGKDDAERQLETLLLFGEC